MTYEVWDGDSGNLLVERPTRVEALLIVREAIARHGESYVDSLALVLEDDDGESHVIAEGRELAKLATNSVRVARPHVKPITTKVVAKKSSVKGTYLTGQHVTLAPGQPTAPSGQKRVPATPQRSKQSSPRQVSIIRDKKSAPSRGSKRTEP